MHEGAPYLVSPLLEGTTLREELTAGPLPQRKAIDYALQIANGLAAAHAKGIIHRDLKPENIFITKDDRVKILDFGLAKLKATKTQNVVRPDDVTLLTTQPGVVLGTVGYMSPEQVRGEEADHRSDIFAFGCIFYEMLSGKRAFHKETSAETMTAILKDEPAEMSAEVSGVSPAVERVARRCLEKAQERRFQSASDLAFALENAGGGLASTGILRQTDAVAAAGPTPLFRAALKLVLILALLGIGIWIGRFLGTQGDRPKSISTKATVRKHGYHFPAATNKTGEASILDLAISPDGRWLVYRNADGLWLKRLDRLDPPKFLGSPQARRPFWSPESTQFAYGEQGKILRLSVDGGNPIQVTDRGGIWENAWLTEERIILPRDNGLSEITLTGGNPTRVLGMQESELDYHDAAPLPDGKGVVFIVHRKLAFDTIAVWTPGGGRKTVYQEEGAMLTRPVYSSTGHILFERIDQNPAIWAFSFSLETLSKSSPEEKPFRVAEGALASVSHDGTLVYSFSASDSFFGRRQLVWVDSGTGKVTGRVGEPLYGLNSPRISPDGTKVVATAGAHLRAFDTWVFDLTRGTAAPLSSNQEQEVAPNWFGGSQKVIYSRWSKEGGRIYTKTVDGLQPEQLLFESVSMHAPVRAPYLLLGRPIYGVPWAYLPLQATNQTPIPFPETLSQAMNPKLSPDGKLLAYALGEGPAGEIYVVEFPGFTNNTPVSRGGGKRPEWQADGSHLFYITPDNRSMMAVKVGRDGALSEPLRVCDLPESIFVAQPFVPNTFDVSADGKRFLMVEWVNDPSEAEAKVKPDVVLVENWFEEFRRK